MTMNDTPNFIRRQLDKMHRSITDFIRNNRGAAAIEFAIVGPVYLVLALSTMEVGLILTKDVLLDNAMIDASKYVYVGAAQSGAVDQEDLEAFICDRMDIVMQDCENNLALELINMSSFNQTIDHSAPCRDSATEIEPVVQFNPGTSGDIMFIRACLTTDVILPGVGMGLALSKTETGRYQIVSQTAFLNEPF